MYTWSWAWGRFSFNSALIIGIFMIAYRLPKRKNFWVRLLCCLAIFVAETFLYELVKRDLEGLIPLRGAWFLFFLIQYLMSIFIAWVCYDCTFWVSLFCASVGYCLQHFTQRLLYCLFTHGILINVDFPWWGEVPLLIFITAGVYLLVWFFVIKKNDNSLAEIISDNKVQIVVSGMAIALLIVLNTVLMGYVNSRPGRYILDWFSMLCAIALLLLQFTILKMKRNESELQKLQRILAVQCEQFEKEQADAELLHVRLHDLRHQIRALEGTADQAALHEIITTVYDYESYIKTGNGSIDTVLTKYNGDCIKSGIRFSCLLDGSHYNFIQPHELYTLFGNAVENAIRAVKILPEEKRSISITEKRHGAFVVLRIVNYFDGKLTFKNELPVTTQDENEGHGFGVRSIQLLAEKYGGRIRITAEEDTFILEIFFPMRAQEESEIK